MAAAIAGGYLAAERADPQIVEASQKGFPAARGQGWGRVLMCRLFGVATPRYRNMPMVRFWWGALSLKQKAQSLFGTVKRILRKGLRRRAACTPFIAPRTAAEKVAAAAAPGAGSARPGQ